MDASPSTPSKVMLAREPLLNGWLLLSLSVCTVSRNDETACSGIARRAYASSRMRCTDGCLWPKRDENVWLLHWSSGPEIEARLLHGAADGAASKYPETAAHNTAAHQ